MRILVLAVMIEAGFGDFLQKCAKNVKKEATTMMK